MARRQTTQWGIQFGTWVNTAGYEWQRLPWVDENHDVLVPKGQVQRIAPGVVSVSGGPITHRQRLGLGVARNAFKGFRALAKEIMRVALTGNVTWVDDTGSTLTNSGELAQRRVVSEEECRRLIVEYANKYGSLWGDRDPRTMRDWRREAADFLDLDDISTALKTADFRAFDRCVIEPTPDRQELTYWSGHAASRVLEVARAGQSIDRSGVLHQSLSTPEDVFATAVHGSSRVRARMLLSRQINRKVAGGLSLQVSLFNENKAFVAPHQLVHLLYTRMWLDTVDAEAIERETRCRNCGREIAGTSRKQYCSDACRWQFNNRRRATSP